ncbi:MAG TPA: UrcA family protein [Gammaproteobacteria bacterium]|nr:UrcA family protein [Gammaproteobacteria bacterium]
MKFSTRSIPSLSALLLLGWSASTLAAPTRAGDVPTKTVRFADLDISTAIGAETLYGRIRTAARIVCRAQPASAVRECRARAVDDAVSKLGNSLLSSIHRSTVERVEEVVRR